MVTITIIIPAYNVEDYILETLESINRQEVLPDEVIIIDDGSVDSTAKLIKEFKARFVLKLFETENRGQGPARNLGVEHATSDYIYFFDSDDLIAHNAIKVLKKHLKPSLPDMLLFNGVSFSEIKISDGRIDSITYNKRKYVRGFAGSFDNRSAFIGASLPFGNLACSPCLYVVKRESIADRLKFNQWYHEDQVYFSDLIFTSNSFQVIDNVLFYRRVRQNSTTTIKKNSKHFIGMSVLVQSQLQLLEKYPAPSVERRYIINSLESFVLSYLLVARKANLEVNVAMVLRALALSKSWLFRLKCIVRLCGCGMTRILSLSMLSRRAHD